MSARAEFEARERRRVSAELASKQARETQIKPVDLQAKLDSTKIIAAKARADIQKIGIQTTAIKESKAEIEASIKRLESGIQSKTNIEKIQAQIKAAQIRIKEATPKRPTQQPRPSGRGILNILDVTANMLIGEANLKTNAEFKADIEKYGSISGARANQPRPTGKELKARLGLSLIEPILGGGREALFPFANTLGQGRPETEGLRIVGALITPTAADLVAGWVLAKTGVTKAGRKLLRKLDDYLSGVDPIFPKLTPTELDEVRQWEKMGHTPTSLRRSAQRNPDIITTIEEMAAFYEKNPAQFSAGASVIPEEVFIFNKVAYDFDMEPTELVNFIKKNGDLFADGTLLAAIIPTLSNADAAIVLEGTTLFPPDLIEDTVERLREETWSDQTPIIDEDEEQIIVPIIDVPEDVPPVEEPPIVVPDLDIPTRLDTPLPPPEEIIPDEDPLIVVPLTPPIILGKKDRKKRNTLNLRLFRGAKSMFKVTFFFTKSMTEVIPIEARSFVEAVNKAQRSRKARKKQPRLVDVVKV